MCIEDTLMDISFESRLNKAEKLSLRLIAIDVKRLQKDNIKLRRVIVRALSKCPSKETEVIKILEKCFLPALKEDK